MTNAEAWCNNSLRPRKPEGSLGWTAQDGHLDSHTAPELWVGMVLVSRYLYATKYEAKVNEKVTKRGGLSLMGGLTVQTTAVKPHQ